MNAAKDVDPNRLLDAADVLLQALAAERGGDANTSAQGTDAVRNPALMRYTIAELVEAMAMLWRLGLVPPRPELLRPDVP